MVEKRILKAVRAMEEGGALWILRPERATGARTDLTRAAGFAADPVDFRVCAVDGVWSGLLFARRRRPGGEGTGREGEGPRVLESGSLADGPRGPKGPV